MKIELHGSGFEEFELPRWCKGVDVVPNGLEPSQDGKYPVKAVDSITILSSGHLYVGVELLPDDEHLAVTDIPVQQETAEVTQ